MGCTLSCDICNRAVSDHENIWENLDSEHTHVCVDCYKPEVHAQHQEKNAGALMQAEDERRAPQASQAFGNAISKFEKKHFYNCKCGMDLIIYDDTDSCIRCAEPIRMGIRKRRRYQNARRDYLHRQCKGR
jgi:hypothetical protein